MNLIRLEVDREIQNYSLSLRHHPLLEINDFFNQSVC